MMTSLITNTIDNKLTFEELLIVTLLATTAFFLVALGGALYHKSKQKDEKVPVSQLRTKKKQRLKKKNETTTPSQLKKLVVVDNKIEISAETVLTDLKRYAMSDAWRHKIVYTFLDDLGRETINLSFKEIDQAARKIATVLQRDAVVRKGDKVILCYPPGLDFALAFWGCLYAGVVGIPVYPPYPGTLTKDLPKFSKLVEDSTATIVLTNTTYHLASKMATVKKYFSTARISWPANVQWITTDNLPDSLVTQYKEEDALSLSYKDVAFFQYSSGSTSAPKAVMISHGNLKAQIKTWESIVPTDTMVSWLPSYHDMGLVGFIIIPCVTAARCVSMSPISFIKDPALWMRTASMYKATHVCAPNFGFALAARKTSDTQVATMDLSTLKHTICAAEPIRRESLEAFTSKFKAAGFDPNTFNCGYGLAEVTLVCTGQLCPQKPTLLDVNKHVLETQRKAVILSTNERKQFSTSDVLQLVGCGKAMPTFSVLVVDPDTKTSLDELQIGEIWVQGPSVAIGYWNRSRYTEKMFCAQLAGAKSSSNIYLRTGDLGFLHKSELFVTGRLKDLIIIRGRNVCPQDVETSVEHAHEYVRPGCTAAFSIENGDEEALVVVTEVRNGSSLQTLEVICREIIEIVLLEHHLKCEAIVLLRQKTVPKTTSGKIQRSAAKTHFLNGTLTKPLYEYRAKTRNLHVSPSTAPTKLPGENVSCGKCKTPGDILAWLLDYVAREIEVHTAAANTELTTTTNRVNIDPNTPWALFGMDSVSIVGLSSDLGEYLGCVVSPSSFFDYDTPFKLANAPGLASGDLIEGQGKDDQNGVGLIQNATTVEEIGTNLFEIEHFPEVQVLLGQMKQFESAGLRVPFLETLTPEKRRMTNFNTYNYLGNASDPEVAAASKAGIEEYGTTMSSSPIVGQTQVNVDLEKALSTFFYAEASILFVGGWVANVTTIDAIVSKGDLILCDALNHDSCVSGQRLSGATILPFPHNNTEALERMLSRLRMKYRRVLVVIEGVYSMDGDIPDVREMVRIKKKYKALLFIDEAHSFGTMGATGRGVCEHFDVDPRDIDIRMGTMSKALGSVGGFILGSEILVKYLKHCAGGFVFSVGLAPACASAALKSVELMTKAPTRTLMLQERSKYFYDLCKKNMIPMGENTFRGAPVVVVIIGTTIATANASEFLALHQINVKPIVYPAVEEGKCRLRFFISALHKPKQMEDTVIALKTYLFTRSNNATMVSQVIKPTCAVNGIVTNGVDKATKDDRKTKRKRKTKKKKSTKAKTC